jgi:Uncharacterized conserved protein (COG2071)
MTEAVDCTIERRLLLNYRIEPSRVAPLLPAPLRPQLVQGWAVGGICLLRLRELRPDHLPRVLGFTTENVAHRFAVEWEDEGGRQVGVYVPRRDTGSHLAARMGGWVFPGDYRLAQFKVVDRAGRLEVAVESRDATMRIEVVAHESDHQESDLFESVDAALRFFRTGSLGLSPARRSRGLDRVRLISSRWEASPVEVERIASSLFDDPDRFPEGSCVFDSALVMRDLPVRWEAVTSALPLQPAA